MNHVYYRNNAFVTLASYLMVSFNNHCCLKKLVTLKETILWVTLNSPATYLQ